MKTRTIYGVCMNDADYSVYKKVCGRQVCCPFYQTWTNMLKRCYCKNLHKKHPTYTGCSVVDEWKTFSNFRCWMEQMEWEGKHLDKDILYRGNKVYSQDTCVFIPRNLNLFLLDCGKKRGEWPLGVHWNKRDGVFVASCNDGKGRVKHLGYFDCPQKAHEEWRRYKHKLACRYADEQNDPRIAKALRLRYDYEYWYEANKLINLEEYEHVL